MSARFFLSLPSPPARASSGRLAAAAAAAVIAVFGSACATGPEAAPAARKHPPRGAGCTLALYRTPVPSVAAWDDLGVAEVGCHINTSQGECLRRFYAEACRMGGDMIYNLPRRPMRPNNQAVVFRGQVAHSIGAPPKPGDKDADLPPPASSEEAAGPVVPLGAPAGGAAPAAGAPPLPRLRVTTPPRAVAPTAPPAPTAPTAPAAGAATAGDAGTGAR